MSLQGKFYKPYWLVDAKAIMTGDHLNDARPNQNTTEGTIVEFQLDNEGGRRFRTETGRHVGDFMAIVLDHRVMTAPVIQSAIATRGQITMGGKSLADAQDLSLVLRAGALPVPLRVAQSQKIGRASGRIRSTRAATRRSSRGARRGDHAGVLSLSGLLAVAGLVLYMLYTLAA